MAGASSPQPRQLHAKASLDRRDVLLLSSVLPLCSSGSAIAAEATEVEGQIEVLATAALKAYSDNDLPRAREYFDKIVAKEPSNPVWLERRGQVFVDMKLFGEAIDDFNAAESMYSAQSNGTYASLGLLSNRALAYEGLYKWKEAVDDYSQVWPHSVPQHCSTAANVVPGLIPENPAQTPCALNFSSMRIMSCI